MRSSDCDLKSDSRVLISGLFVSLEPATAFVLELSCAGSLTVGFAGLSSEGLTPRVFGRLHTKDPTGPLTPSVFRQTEPAVTSSARL